MNNTDKQLRGDVLISYPEGDLKARAVAEEIARRCNAHRAPGQEFNEHLEALMQSAQVDKIVQSATSDPDLQTLLSSHHGLDSEYGRTLSQIVDRHAKEDEYGPGSGGDDDGSADDGAEGTAPPKTAAAEPPKTMEEAERRIRQSKGWEQPKARNAATRAAPSCEQKHGKAAKAKK